MCPHVSLTQGKAEPCSDVCWVSCSSASELSDGTLVELLCKVAVLDLKRQNVLHFGCVFKFLRLRSNVDRCMLCDCGFMGDMKAAKCQGMFNPF